MAFPPLPRYWRVPAFIALYLLFDWSTYIDPLYGLNITPWNPDPALGLVVWLRYGWRAAPAWFVALAAGEALVRGTPAGLGPTLLLSLWLTVGYGLIGEALRRRFGAGGLFESRRGLFDWVAIIAVGTVLNDLVYITLLEWGGLVPAGQWGVAVLRFGIGDMVGVLVSMPLIWMLSSGAGRRRLRATVWRFETLGYLALAIAVLYLVFGSIATSQFKEFYFLFLPVVWAASRQGLYGTALMVFVLQAGIGALVKWNHAGDLAVHELQMLDAVLALVGFSIGVVVDQLRRMSDELERSLRLAAAGEMAAVLAHELNQPLTALGAYGKACELLLERDGDGGAGAPLRTAVQRMVAESVRAAEVVRRLRDFFRGGALRLEAVDPARLAADVGAQFAGLWREHGVEFTLGAIPARPVLADRLQLELVLRNLLANALDAVRERPPGARRVALSARLVARRLGAGLPAPGGRGQRRRRQRGAGGAAVRAVRLEQGQRHGAGPGIEQGYHGGARRLAVGRGGRARHFQAGVTAGARRRASRWGGMKWMGWTAWTEWKDGNKGATRRCSSSTTTRRCATRWDCCWACAATGRRCSTAARPCCAPGSRTGTAAC